MPSIERGRHPVALSGMILLAVRGRTQSQTSNFGNPVNSIQAMTKGGHDASATQAFTVDAAAIHLRCPRCGGNLPTPRGASILCPTCKAEYPIIDNIPSIMPAQFDIKVHDFFEQVPDNSETGDLSYTPQPPWYMEYQFRVYATTIQRMMLRWLTPGVFVLDIGCGHGKLLLPIAQRFRICGIDFSFGLLKSAQSLGYRVYHADATNLPFADNQFDAITCFEVLQHFPDPAPLMNGIARVCRPGGVILISTLNQTSLLRRLLRAAARALGARRYDLPIIRRTVEEVVAVAVKSGLVLEEIGWILSPSTVVLYKRRTGGPLSPLATNFTVLFKKP